MKHLITSIIIISCLSNGWSKAQLYTTQQLLLQHITQPEKLSQPHWHTDTLQSSNIAATITRGGFYFYKNYIVWMDNQRCGFSPSCSVYGLTCIHHHGFGLGILMAIDRLQRCNGLSPEWYTIDPLNHLLYDPVK